MKCNKCGANYDSVLVECPFCGEINTTGVEWEKEKNSAKLRLDNTRKMVIHSGPLYVINRVVNAILIVLAIAAVLGFITLAIIFFVEEKIDERKQKNADYEVALELYQQGEYYKLDQYMEEHKINSLVDGYDLFLEAVRLNYQYDEFMEKWMRYEKDKNNVEYINSHPYWYATATDMLWECAEILQKGNYLYNVKNEENIPLYDRIVSTAKLFLMSEFGYSEEEIVTYFEDDDIGYSEFRDKVVRDAFSRKKWIYNEE